MRQMSQTNTPGPGDFASSVQSTPAVIANGRNGSIGLQGMCDAGTGVYGMSTAGGTGVYGASIGGLSGHFAGDVQVDHDLKVSESLNVANLYTAILTSGPGAFTSTPPNPSEFPGYADFVEKSAITATGIGQASGVSGTSSSGPGITGTSSSGPGVYGMSQSGLAGHFAGNVQIDNNLNVSGSVGIDPHGPGGMIIGNPSISQGGFSSLLLDISAESGGFATIQAIKASGTEWGDIGINARGGNVGIGRRPQVRSWKS